MDNRRATTRADAPSLLFLSHRIPFPPNKGDKIRSFNLLRLLAPHFRVYLGAFIDDPADEPHAETLSQYCIETHFVRLHPLSARIKSAWGFATGEPLSWPYYRSAAMDRWVDDLARRVRMDTVFVFSSPMAQYAFAPGLNRSRKVIDFVDVDSDKWAQYALERSGPIAWIYNREARLLSKFEQDAAHRFDVSIFVSDAEADLFRTRLPGDHTNVIAVPNGVDADYFSPNHHFPSPFRNGESPVVFVGAMDYWPNVDAVLWFKQAILPTVLQAVANARFYIVGAKPAPSVTRLAGTDTVVTARVEDVRPYVANAAVVIAPMRIARGVQNKVLEGMALGKPVVTTSKGLEGIVALPNREVLVADSADSFAGAVIRTLLTPNLAMGDAARARVVADYSWDSAWERLRPHLGG